MRWDNFGEQMRDVTYTENRYKTDNDLQFLNDYIPFLAHSLIQE